MRGHSKRGWAKNEEELNDQNMDEVQDQLLIGGDRIRNEIAEAIGTISFAFECFSEL